MPSSLEIMDIETRETVSVYSTERQIEAPNWAPDNSRLLFNCEGRIYRHGLAADREPEEIDTGQCVNCNNDHGVSPDGKFLAISDSTETGQSCIYVLPAAGGTPRRITADLPSWWHGWSPDGRTIAFTARRDGIFSIRTIPVGGAAETCVIEGGGHYDGPDFTPDGEWIWFNSDRSGTMQLWRVRTGGSNAQQMTEDERVNWFPHPSPDGKHVVYLAYEAGTEGHPRGRNVELRIMPADGGPPRLLVRLFGGQGTINVPSWSPGSRRFAYIRYFEN